MASDDSRGANFIGRVVSDPKNPPETRLLSGWPGDAADEGYRRLYTDAALNAYVDIPGDAILHTEPIRDVQPAGAIFVWVKADAELKHGGSAASRAARFLEGQVQKDFASGGKLSLEKLGIRCVTRDPCAEPTGFTGQCTEQPEVGGCWPCITLIPHCAEPTGFTGKCTPLPWPNPTKYVGCTYLHCPTFDLTCIPQICNIVATGMPGCQVDDPRGGGVVDPGARLAAAAEPAEGEEGGGAEAAAAPATHLLGCGFTRQWGPCETQLLGCGYTKDWGHNCPTQLLGCGVTKACPSAFVPCVSQGLPNCGGDPFAARSNLTACTQIDCTARDLGGDRTLATVCTQIGCARSAATVCTQLGCGIDFPGGGVADPGQRFAAFAAAPRAPEDTQLFVCNPSAFDACPTTHGCITVQPTALETCTQLGAVCPTPETTCTQVGPSCPTACGPDCQTQQFNCTQVGEICLTRPVECTQFGPKCPTIAAVCPTPPPGCPQGTNPILDCTFGCTLVGPNCVSAGIRFCPVDTAQVCINRAAGGAQAFAAAGPGGPIGPTGVQGCTQTNNCLTIPNGDCTFFGGCPSAGQAHCTCSGPGCPTPATVCTQAGCPTSFQQCATELCVARGLQQPQQQRIAAAAPTIQQPQCAPTPATVCFICPPLTSNPLQCPQPTPATRCLICSPRTPNPFFCGHPTPATQCFVCPPITRNLQCGGGPSAVDACPTRICGGGFGGQ